MIEKRLPQWVQRIDWLKEMHVPAESIVEDIQNCLIAEMAILTNQTKLDAYLQMKQEQTGVYLCGTCKHLATFDRPCKDCTYRNGDGYYIAEKIT